MKQKKKGILSKIANWFKPDRQEKKLSKAAKETLKKLYELEVKNRYKAAEIKSKKLDIDEMALQIDEKEIDVKKKKFERDTARYQYEIDEIESTYDNEEEEPERQTNLIEEFAAGALQNVFANNKRSQTTPANNRDETGQDNAAIDTDENEKIA